MDFFNNKHRTDSIRLKEWDYSSSAYYFITICTKNRKPFLGRVVKENIELSEIGELCNSYWSEIPKHFRNATLDEYIMPNHIHGILIIDNPTVETRHGVSLQDDNFTNKFSKLISGSLSVIVNQYKSS
ncbi:MAG: transposase, partial [Thermodesulfobacteriota bacterium]